MATLRQDRAHFAPVAILTQRQHQVAAAEARSLVAPRLSQREKEVLREWLMHDSKNTVARSLFLSLGTVNTHLTRIRSKYDAVGRGATTKTALTARALQDGIITLDEL